MYYKPCDPAGCKYGQGPCKFHTISTCTEAVSASDPCPESYELCHDETIPAEKKVFCIGEVFDKHGNKYNIFGFDRSCYDPPYNLASPESHTGAFRAYTSPPARVSTDPWCIGINYEQLLNADAPYRRSFLKQTSNCANKEGWNVTQIYLPTYNSEQTVATCMRTDENGEGRVYMESLGKQPSLLGTKCREPEKSSNADAALTWGAPAIVYVLDFCAEAFQSTDDLMTCENVNECNVSDVRRHDCDAQATCTDLNGAKKFSCACNAGWEDDNLKVFLPGRQCKNIDECNVKSPSHNCDGHATCTDLQGSFDCQCNAGWENSDGVDDGTACSDINECNIPNQPWCDAQNSECRNTIGSYACDCGQGWHHAEFGTLSLCLPTSAATTAAMCATDEDLRTCEDFDECEDDTTHDCHAAATCNNDVGSFNCQCNNGWEKTAPFYNGTDCANVDECALETDNCFQYSKTDKTGFVEQNVSGATCTDAEGSFTCQCDTGWLLPEGGDGSVCDDVDECDANSTLTNTCDEHAACANSDGSFTCKCSQGWQSVAPDFDSTACENVNECENGKSIF